MKIKSVTIEMENGQELTMGMDKVEDFFQSVERLKQAAAPKPEEQPTQFNAPQDHLIQWKLAEQQRAMLAVQQQQDTLFRQSRNMYPPTTGTTSARWEDLFT